jgi:hypothetical protein
LYHDPYEHAIDLINLHFCHLCFQTTMFFILSFIYIPFSLEDMLRGVPIISIILTSFIIIYSDGFNFLIYLARRGTLMGAMNYGTFNTSCGSSLLCCGCLFSS